MVLSLHENCKLCDGQGLSPTRGLFYETILWTVYSRGKRRVRFWVKCFLMVFALVQPTLAVASCYEPYPPTCASAFGEFEDEWEYERCKSEMET